MGSAYLTSPLLFIINTLFDLYLLLVILRFLLQMLRADFYNPVSQFVVKATTPPLKPLRKIIPGFGGQDIAALVLSLIVLIAKYLLILLLGSPAIEIASAVAQIGQMSPVGLLITAIAEIISTFINIFLFAIIIEVIMSWIQPAGHNPVLGLIFSITRPVLSPIRRIMPNLGGLDLSPLFASVGLIVLKMLLIPPIIYLAILV